MKESLLALIATIDGINLAGRFVNDRSQTFQAGTRRLDSRALDIRYTERG